MFGEETSRVAEGERHKKQRNREIEAQKDRMPETETQRDRDTERQA